MNYLTFAFPSAVYGKALRVSYSSNEFIQLIIEILNTTNDVRVVMLELIGGSLYRVKIDQHKRN